MSFCTEIPVFSSTVIHIVCVVVQIGLTQSWEMSWEIED